VNWIAAVPAPAGAPSSRAPAGVPYALPCRAGLHRIVIVGGGAGGLELAVALGERLGRPGRAEVLLVDAVLTHLWKPLLHELAAGTLPPQQAGVDFLQQARAHRFRFHPGRLDGLDQAGRHVLLAALLDDEGREVAPRRAIGYDTLVLAVGSVVDDFHTPGVAQHASRLDTASDARRFHRRLLAACARAELQASGPVDIVIVGGGATGVELAAELHDAVAEIAGYGSLLGRLPQPVRLTLVELGPRLLAGQPQAVADAVQRDLAGLGVNLRLRQRVTEVAAGHVVLEGGERVGADLTVWAAGIQGPPVLAQLDGLELGPRRQLVVRPTLQTSRDDAIFAIGDCARCVPEPGGPAVPPLAQAAHQQARFLVRALDARLHRRPLPAFRFRDRGGLVSVGRHRAAGQVVRSGEPDTARPPAPSHGGARPLGRLRLHGRLGWLAYRALQLQHLAALHGAARTLLATLGGWLTARTQSRVKLH
jgi:NADH dehydrogenase